MVLSTARRHLRVGIASKNFPWPSHSSCAGRHVLSSQGSCLESDVALADPPDFTPDEDTLLRHLVFTGYFKEWAALADKFNAIMAQRDPGNETKRSSLDLSQRFSRLVTRRRLEYTLRGCNVAEAQEPPDAWPDSPVTCQAPPRIKQAMFFVTMLAALLAPRTVRVTLPSFGELLRSMCAPAGAAKDYLDAHHDGDGDRAFPHLVRLREDVDRVLSYGRDTFRKEIELIDEAWRKCLDNREEPCLPQFALPLPAAAGSSAE